MCTVNAFKREERKEENQGYRILLFFSFSVARFFSRSIFPSNSFNRKRIQRGKRDGDWEIYTCSRCSEIKFVPLFFRTLPEFNIQIVFPERKRSYTFWYRHGQIEIRTISCDITRRSIQKFEKLQSAAFSINNIYTDVSLTNRWTSRAILTVDGNDK